jgi:hypothetical protein
MAHRMGVVTVASDRLSSAIERVEGLGCVVLFAQPVSAGKYRLNVRVPTLEAGNAVAYAVARRGLEWCGMKQFSLLAS